jgi:hypothetical protein
MTVLQVRRVLDLKKTLNHHTKVRQKCPERSILVGDVIAVEAGTGNGGVDLVIGGVDGDEVGVEAETDDDVGVGIGNIVVVLGGDVAEIENIKEEV